MRAEAALTSYASMIYKYAEMRIVTNPKPKKLVEIMGTQMVIDGYRR